MSTIDDFNKCVDKKKVASVYMVDCKLGLWGVTSSDQDKVIAEAFHYWQQYASDGEYSSIIGGESVTEKLKTALAIS